MLTKLFNETKGTPLAHDVVVADRIFNRLKGLLGKKELKRGEALILKPCNSVHTFFMRFPIDVIFVGREDTIVGIQTDCKPWRLTPVYWRAHYAIEFPAGTLLESRTAVGDRIQTA